MVKKLLKITAFLTGFSGIASAQTSMQLPINTSVISQEESNLESSKKTKSTQTIDVRSDYYFHQNENFYRKGASGEMSSLSLQTEGQKSFTSSSHFNWQIADSYSSSEGWNYLKPRELYFETKKTNWSVAFGAKHFEQLKTSQTWSNPIWYSRYRDDKVNPQSIGQVGLHSHFNLGDGWSVSSVLIAANIPDFGAHQTIEDGQFVSRNPWFRPPPDKIILDLNGETERAVRYQIDQPNVEDIVLKPGAILQIKKELSPKQSLKLVGARKAVPALQLSFPVIYRQLDSDQYLDLSIKPIAVEHTAAALEWSYQTDPEQSEKNKEFFASFQYERPDVPSRPDNWISQNFREAYIGSAGYKQTVALGTVPLGFEVSYWQLWGGDGPDSGQFASATSVFDRRYDFIQAVKLAVSTRKNKIAASSAFTYDYAQQGMLWSNRFNYFFSRSWAAAAIVDLIGLVGPTGRVDDGLLSLYRSNDRFGLGVSYVF